jgi:predicted O-methyltransferase YrrM
MNSTTTYPNWFEGQRYNFENYLLHLAGKPNLKFLQIGVYTGDASIWLCENILTDDTSFLYDIDTWTGSDEKEHEHIDFEKVLEYYKERISSLKSTAWLRMTSDKYFANTKNVEFDFIYIDGDHTAEQVAKDAENAWKVLKPQGIMAFDDYMWGQNMSPELTPKPAIDDFLNNHIGEYNILNKDYQVWLMKK